jgi:hypothetical protein
LERSWGLHFTFKVWYTGIWFGPGLVDIQIEAFFALTRNMKMRFDRTSIQLIDVNPQSIFLWLFS